MSGQNPLGVQVGAPGLSFQEMRVQFALWALMKSPLILANDVGQMTVQQISLVTNREVIAVHQDGAGVPGDRVWKKGPYEVCFLTKIC